MGRPSEKAKFMDDVDITMSLDNRSTATQQLTNIEIHSKNITFRASYRDIILITSILNRAMESYSHSQESRRAEKGVKTDTSPTQINARKSLSIPTGRARVTMIKEQVSNSLSNRALGSRDFEVELFHRWFLFIFNRGPVRTAIITLRGKAVHPRRARLVWRSKSLVILNHHKY